MASSHLYHVRVSLSRRTLEHELLLKLLQVTHFYGLPDAGTDHAVLARGLGARNMAVALSSLTLSFTEQRKPLALLLGAYTLAGISDIWICAHHGNKLPEHIIGTILLATASYLLAR